MSNSTINYEALVEKYYINFVHEGYYPKDRDGTRYIAIANWNNVPEETQKDLENAGYTLEWDDMVGCCNNCNRVVETQPTHMGWVPQCTCTLTEFLCLECLLEQIEADAIDYAYQLSHWPSDTETLTRWNQLARRMGYPENQGEYFQNIGENKLTEKGGF
jgi:hypothetical protein